jgi:hypothetical protein
LPYFTISVQEGTETCCRSLRVFTGPSGTPDPEQVLFAEIFEVPLGSEERKYFVFQKRLVCGFDFRRHRKRQLEFLCNNALKETRIPKII